MCIAATIQKTPLESWIAKKIGVNADELTSEQIQYYQLKKLRETIQRAYLKSPFYKNILKGFVEKEITCLTDLQRFPFTTQDDIRENGHRFLCVSQDEISRIVTLDSSGTTGRKKRIYFTAADQELTIDFFQQGMDTLVKSGDRVLILLPGERSGSVGDLLATALNRLDVEPVSHGVVCSLPETLKVIAAKGVNSIVGIPTQVLALARYADQIGISVPIKSVLLSTDYVPKAIIKELERIWGCQVFEHYGMTEMGLGGGIDCAAHNGYHLRETDLYFEIVDPDTGENLPIGQKGEVVFTTLTRQGMPLIRYRTGDLARFLPGSCSCGTILKRLERIKERKNGRIYLRENQYFNLADLDESIFQVNRVLNYTASVDNFFNAAKLTISTITIGQPDEFIRHAVYEAVKKVASIRQAHKSNELDITIETVGCRDILMPSTAKRSIMEMGIDDY